PGGEREEDERHEAEHAEERELESARVQADGGEPWQGELGDLRAELADRLAGPELEEVGVAPEPARGAAEARHPGRGGRGRARARAARPSRRRRRGSRP